MLPLRIPNPHRSLSTGIRAGFLGLLGLLAFSSSLEMQVTATSSLPIRVDDGTLAEIKDKHRVALLIKKNSVLDVSGSEEPIVNEALAADPRDSLRHRYPYRVIARKLNQYVRKYGTMQPVYNIAQADFIIYFRLVEYRQVLNTFYPCGEMFVIVNQRETQPARVIWRTKKVRFAEDAINDLIKELKRTRDER
jgi:hypothetical protein